jgi:hypothetical protein
MASRQPKDEETSVHINPEMVINSIARIDEKINNTLKKQDELSARFEKLLDYYNKLLERVVGVESKNIGNITEIINGLLVKLGIIEKSIADIKIDPSLKNDIKDLIVRVSVIEKIIQESKNSGDETTKTIKKLELDNQKLITFKQDSEQRSKNIFGISKKVFTILFRIAEAVTIAWLIFRFGLTK